MINLAQEAKKRVMIRRQIRLKLRQKNLPEIPQINNILDAQELQKILDTI